MLLPGRFVPSFMRIGSWNVLMFVTYEQLKRLLSNGNNNSSSRHTDDVFVTHYVAPPTSRVIDNTNNNASPISLPFGQLNLRELL